MKTARQNIYQLDDILKHCREDGFAGEPEIRTMEEFEQQQILDINKIEQDYRNFFF